MKNFIYTGDSVDFEIDEPVYSGEPYLKGAFFGVANTDGLAGESISFTTVGVVELPKAQEVIAAGDAAYFDAENKVVTNNKTDNKLIGVFLQSEVAAEPEARLKLLGGGIALEP